MVAIVMGIIVGFTILTLAFFFTAFLVAAWPVFFVVGLWLLAREVRLRQEALAREP